MREIHSRLALLYPEADIAHMPAEHMQAHAACLPDKPGTGAAQDQSAQAAGPSQAARPAQGHLRQESASTAAGQPSGEGAVGLIQHDNAVVEGAHALEGALNSRAPGHAEGSSASAQNGQGANGEERLEGTNAEPGGEDSREPEQATFCAPLVGNAAVAGDQYSWHVDADPATLPDSRCAYLTFCCATVCVGVPACFFPSTGTGPFSRVHVCTWHQWLWKSQVNMVLIQTSSAERYGPCDCVLQVDGGVWRLCERRARAAAAGEPAALPGRRLAARLGRRDTLPGL